MLGPTQSHAGELPGIAVLQMDNIGSYACPANAYIAEGVKPCVIRAYRAPVHERDARRLPMDAKIHEQ